MYTYNFYDIQLDSEVEMPELPDGTTLANPRVTIRWGDVQRPQDAIEGAHYKPDSVAHRDFYFLEVDDIARYYLEGKERIIVERLGDATDKDVVAFLIDTVLTVLLLKHRKFVFHASAIAGPRGAIMLCGHSGIGKSSIALRMVDSGLTFIEDDRCLLSWDESTGKIYIKNHIPFIDIWANESKKLEKMEGAKIMHPIRDNIAKLRVDIREYVDNQRIPLDKVITLTAQNELKPPEVKVITGVSKCRWAKSFTHMEHLIPDISDAHTHFNYIMHMLSTVPMIRISRSRRAKPGEVADFIMEEILSKEVHEIIETEEE